MGPMIAESEAVRVEQWVNEAVEQGGLLKPAECEKVCFIFQLFSRMSKMI